MAANTIFAILTLVLAAIAAIYLIGTKKGKEEQVSKNISEAPKGNTEEDEKL